MRRFFLSIIITLLPAISRAQSESLSNADHYIQKAETYNSENTPSYSEQGYDTNDSLYYIRLKTYTLPYKSKKEKAIVNGVMEELARIYDTEIPLLGNTGYSAVLCNGGTEQPSSELVSMYYKMGEEPFIVGGAGKSYVIVRHQDASNPWYRTIDGVEWSHGKNSEEMLFRVFHLRGPKMMSKSGRMHFESIRDSKYGKQVEARVEDIVNTVLDHSDSTRLKGKPYMLLEIESLRKYLRLDPETETDVARIHVINERVERYLGSSPTMAELLSLFYILNRIPGYYVEITNRNQTKKGCSFAALANMYPSLTNIAFTTWSKRGDPNCNTYGEKSKNFLYEIRLGE